MKKITITICILIIIVLGLLTIIVTDKIKESQTREQINSFNDGISKAIYEIAASQGETGNIIYLGENQTIKSKNLNEICGK